MAEELNFKVSYVKITEDGLERHNNIMLNDISAEERKDIKSLTFLPIKSERVWDISSILKGFSILEYLYLPSTMTITLKEAVKECPMLKSLLLLTSDNASNSLSQCVVKVNATEMEGDNTAEFRTFVTTTKDGRQVFEVNSKQIQNKPIIEKIEKVNMLSLSQIGDYILGDRGIAPIIADINKSITDNRCKIDITKETLEILLSMFVEKGVTFEEFTIDFSKLYDKIESYKTIIKNVNQVSIKEEVETSIVEAYQNVLRVHYENVLKNVANSMNQLCKVATENTKETLLNDLTALVIKVIVENPDFSEEEYGTNGALNAILDHIPAEIARNLKLSKDRNLVKTYLTGVVTNLKANYDLLVSKVDGELSNKASLDYARNEFAKRFGLDNMKAQNQKLVNTFVDALVEKNFGVLTKSDVLGAIKNIKNELRNGEVQGRELLNLIKNTVSNYPTEYEIRDVLVQFVAENGYEAMKTTNT